MLSVVSWVSRCAALKNRGRAVSIASERRARLASESDSHPERCTDAEVEFVPCPGKLSPIPPSSRPTSVLRFVGREDEDIPALPSRVLGVYTGSSSIAVPL